MIRGTRISGPKKKHAIDSPSSSSWDLRKLVTWILYLKIDCSFHLIPPERRAGKVCLHGCPLCKLPNGRRGHFKESQICSNLNLASPSVLCALALCLAQSWFAGKSPTCRVVFWLFHISSEKLWPASVCHKRKLSAGLNTRLAKVTMNAPWCFYCDRFVYPLHAPCHCQGEVEILFCLTSVSTS